MKKALYALFCLVFLAVAASGCCPWHQKGEEHGGETMEHGGDTMEHGGKTL